jgi:hypothetical protein
MNWLYSNWIWLALGAAAIFMFRRGGCGMGHSGHDHGRHREGDQNDPGRKTMDTPFATAAEPGSESTLVPSTGHMHGARSAGEGALTTERAGHDSAKAEAGPRQHHHGC